MSGDLEAVEEQAGAVGFELVGGETSDDLGKGMLDVAAGAERGEGEASTGAGVGGGFAGGVVEVAEAFVAERG